MFAGWELTHCSIYWSEQTSMRTRLLLIIDWIKRGIFGRDLSKVSPSRRRRDWADVSSSDRCLWYKNQIYRFEPMQWFPGAISHFCHPLNATDLSIGGLPRNAESATSLSVLRCDDERSLSMLAHLLRRHDCPIRVHVRDEACVCRYS